MPLFAHLIPGVRPLWSQRHKAALSKFSSMLDLPVSPRTPGLVSRRFAFLLRLQVQGQPSLADPLGGRNFIATLSCFARSPARPSLTGRSRLASSPLTRWTFLGIRFAQASPLDGARFCESQTLHLAPANSCFFLISLCAAFETCQYPKALNMVFFRG